MFVSIPHTHVELLASKVIVLGVKSLGAEFPHEEIHVD